MTSHTSIVHRRDHWIRWGFSCSCGVTRWVGGKEEAELAEQDHQQDAVDSWTCTCYDPRSMEFDPAGPCRVCREQEASA